MMVIATALQLRILDAATRHLGANGEQVVHQVVHDELGSSLDALTYDRLPELLISIERAAPALVGGARAQNLARALEELAESLDANLVERLIGALGDSLGPAATAFFHTMCTRLDIEPASVRYTDVVPLAELAGRLAAEVLGLQEAKELARAMRAAATWTRSELISAIQRCSIEHAGPEGPAILERFSRERAEVELEELDRDGIALLAGIVRREGAAVLGEHAAAALLAAMRHAVSGPGSGMRARLSALAYEHIGPAAELFLTGVCARNGLPFEALCYEHLTWFAAKLQDESAPYIGAEHARAFARDAAALLDAVE